jgi:hypothetical protein
MGDKPIAAGKSSFDLIDTAKTFAIMHVKPNSCFLDLACGIGINIATSKILLNQTDLRLRCLLYPSGERIDSELNLAMSTPSALTCPAYRYPVSGPNRPSGPN